MSSQLPQTPDVDLRPWRSQVRALLGDVTKEDDTIAALVNAFETHGLTLGGTARPASTDHLGRFRKPGYAVADHTVAQLKERGRGRRPGVAPGLAAGREQGRPVAPASHEDHLLQRDRAG